MEDSRNIIKAIDALTLKAGGEVVDSKNITEAIDHLKEVYGAEVESAISGYTPTIFGNSTVAVQNIGFMYFRFGGMMLISGRFNLTNKGDGKGFLQISLPTGFKVTTGTVGSYGIITPDINIENKASYASMSIRGDINADTIFVQCGAGVASIPYMQTGFHMIFAVIPVTKTA